MMPLEWFMATMLLIASCVLMFTMCVDVTNRWRELKAAVRRDLKPEADSAE